MNNFNDDRVNIVVIIALAEEHDIFCRTFSAKKDISDDRFVRTIHDHSSSRIRLMSVLCENMGSENAMSAVRSATKDLNPDLVVCIGIAGSLSKDVKLGDVCVSSEIVDILQNTKVTDVARSRQPAGRRASKTVKQTKIEFCPRGYPIENKLHANFRFFRSQPSREDERSAWVKSCTERNFKAYCIEDEDREKFDEQITASLHVGAIVCGPVVSSKDFKDQISQMNRKFLAVETESGGILRECTQDKIPAITIRGISDLADRAKSKLERDSKNAFREIAMQNAIELFDLQLSNSGFLELSFEHCSKRLGTSSVETKQFSATTVLSRCEEELTSYLIKVSPDYRNKNSNVLLPLPRAQKISINDDSEILDDHVPESIFEALEKYRKVFIRLPKSYPDNTLPWTIALSILKHEIDGKQPLPITFSGDQIAPPSNGIAKSVSFDFSDSAIYDSFCPVLIVNEPNFHSKTKLAFLMAELKQFDDPYILVVSKAESPIAAIDGFKSDLGMIDYVTTSVPFRDIAIYLEGALELEPGEADAAATRLDDTFSKFRLHTHPAYFIGIQESTISALINANQRAELIQLAVDGLLSFVVASDTSEVKMGRTTREEYLSDLAFKIKVEKRSFTKSSLIQDADQFAKNRALEIDSLEFVQGFFKYGLLTSVTQDVSFSLPFLESYLLSQRLINQSNEAKRYFDPELENFDFFTFDLYCERGAHSEVIANIENYVSSTLHICNDNKNVFSMKLVKPRSLGSAAAFVSRAEEMAKVVHKITHHNGSESVRNEKQKLLDARNAVRSTVGNKKRIQREDLSPEIQEQFARLDKLSRSQILLATLIGSGAERLDGATKSKIAKNLLTISERFIHFWTIDRQKIDFDNLRSELLSDESVDALIDQMDLYKDDREEIRGSLALFIDDQEMKTLSGPLATVLNRLSNYAGVRSLKPIVEETQPSNDVEALIKGAWYMDVESERGKRVLKDALQTYKGSELFRLVLANHLMWRIFWHHWQSTSKDAFIDVARYSLKPMGLITSDKNDERAFKGPTN